VRVSWYGGGVAAMWGDLSATGGVSPLRHVATLENAPVYLSTIVVRDATARDVSEMLKNELNAQLSVRNLAHLAFAGFKVVRPVAEVTGAFADLVTTPIDFYQHRRSVLKGVVRGIAAFGTRLSSEGLRLTSDVVELMHGTAVAATRQVNPNAQHLSRGDQPVGVTDGLDRGLCAIGRSIMATVTGVGTSVREMRHGNTAAGVAALPLTLLLPVEGMLNAATQITRGARNAARPSERDAEVQTFKSHGFSSSTAVDDTDDIQVVFYDGTQGEHAS
jgi:hypothetical protein